MKPTSRMISLTCLAAFALLFAVFATAQDDASQITNKLQLRRLPPDGAPSAARPSQARAQITSSGVACPTSTDYGFASGSGISYMKFCVTVNGNIESFESPVGVEQIYVPPAIGGPDEGYGLCDESTKTQYYDYLPGPYGEDQSGNWAAPTTVSHSATSVKIARSTSDALWTLTQTFTSVAGTAPYGKIVMALKNNSGETKDVYLLRAVDFNPWDAGTTGNYNENRDGTNESTFGWLSSGSAGHSLYFGLMLQNVANASPANALSANVGYAAGQQPTLPCLPFDDEGTIINGLGDGVYLYGLTVNPGQTVMVAVRYLSF